MEGWTWRQFLEQAREFTHTIQFVGPEREPFFQRQWRYDDLQIRLERDAWDQRAISNQ
jgi:hypothetical protein